MDSRVEHNSANPVATRFPGHTGAAGSARPTSPQAAAAPALRVFRWPAGAIVVGATAAHRASEKCLLFHKRNINANDLTADLAIATRQRGTARGGDAAGGAMRHPPAASSKQKGCNCAVTHRRHTHILDGSDRDVSTAPHR